LATRHELWGSRLQGPPEPWAGDRRFVDATVHLCEELSSFELSAALAECRKHSTVERYRADVTSENGSLGFVKREFALHERTTSSCIFEEWRDQHGIAEVARAARTRFLRQAV
tara:strand:+ start:64 stop:402 length:339 start_codon:yes stop_codon:yes gene_type:complete